MDPLVSVLEARQQLTTDVDEITAGTLKRFRFDPAVFARTRALVVDKTSPDGRLRVPVAAPGPEDFVNLAPRGSAEGEELAGLGRDALARGEVGVVVLAGGMATRFGGIVKAVVHVVANHSFLHLKLADIEGAALSAGGVVPVFLLTSFATCDEIGKRVQELPASRGRVQILEQSVSMRLADDGKVFRDAAGKPSLCATGHGDLLPTLRASGALTRFRTAGGKLLMISNVDNLAATLDARVIGAHRRGGKSVTVEVVGKEAGDRGGVPLRVGGHLQVVEEFRLPEGFDGSRVPYFNTNTFIIDAEAIDRDFALDWFLVRRKVDGREVIQAERLLGQVTAFLPTQFLVVQRQGREGRFLPVKDRDELRARMPEIQALVESSLAR
jgi:UTP--glucose-1-phosphate uridylyltransferase